MIRSYTNKRKSRAEPRACKSSAEPQRTCSNAENATAGLELRYSCDICEDHFDSETEVEVHRQVGHSRHLRARMAKFGGCKVCGIVIDDEEERRRHLRRRHLLIEDDSSPGPERPVFICNACHAIFFNKKMLFTHLRLRHNFLPNLRRIECPLCDKSVMKRSLEQHFETSHLLRSVAVCPVCLLKQRNRAALERHVAREHPPHHACAFCAYSTRRASALRAHLLSAHARGAAPFPPRPEDVSRYFAQPIKETVTPWKYNVHCTTRGLKLFDHAVCVLCAAPFSHAEEMRTHISKEHSHTHSFSQLPTRALKVCACGAGFLRDVLLKQHILKGCRVAQDRREAAREDADLGRESLSSDELDGGEESTSALKHEEELEQVCIIVKEEDENGFLYADLPSTDDLSAEEDPGQLSPELSENINDLINEWD